MSLKYHFQPTTEESYHIDKETILLEMPYYQLCMDFCQWTGPYPDIYRCTTLMTTGTKWKNTQKNLFMKNSKKTEPQAIIWLQENQGIIIKPTDKGGSTGVMDPEKYTEECMRQHNNRNHFETIWPLPQKGTQTMSQLSCYGSNHT